MVEWHYFPISGKRVCRCHNKQICPAHPTAGVSLRMERMEKSKSAKGVSSKKSSNNPRTVSNNHRRVIVERFHSYRIRFDAKVDWASLFQFDEFYLRNNPYKVIYLDKAIVKVFKKSLLITLRSKCDIKGLSVKEAKVRADAIMDDVISLLPKGITVLGGNVSSVHNAFMNHPTAKHNITVEVNGEKRLICDNSHGVAEFEAIHPIHAVSDSEALEQDNAQLIDKGLSRDVLATSIKALIDDREYYAENLKSHVIAIRELTFMLKRWERRML